ETGLEALPEVVFVARTLVQSDGAAAVCLILAGFLLAHGGIVAVCREIWRGRRAAIHTPGPECRSSSAAPSSNTPQRACSPWSTTSPHIRAGSTGDRKSTRLNSSHVKISYAVFC